jgi:hypothetical protein
MERNNYEPYWRINKSVLYLGMSITDLVYTLTVFIFSYSFFMDFIATFFISAFYLISVTTMKTRHRKGAFYDYVVQKFIGEKVYVIEKNRSPRSN